MTVGGAEDRAGAGIEGGEEELGVGVVCAGGELGAAGEGGADVGELREVRHRREGKSDGIRGREPEQSGRVRTGHEPEEIGDGLLAPGLREQGAVERGAAREERAKARGDRLGIGGAIGERGVFPVVEDERDGVGAERLGVKLLEAGVIGVGEGEGFELDQATGGGVARELEVSLALRGDVRLLDDRVGRRGSTLVDERLAARGEQKGREQYTPDHAASRSAGVEPGRTTGARVAISSSTSSAPRAAAS